MFVGSIGLHTGDTGGSGQGVGGDKIIISGGLKSVRLLVLIC